MGAGLCADRTSLLSLILSLYKDKRSLFFQDWNQSTEKELCRATYLLASKIQLYSKHSKKYSTYVLASME